MIKTKMILKKTRIILIFKDLFKVMLKIFNDKILQILMNNLMKYNTPTPAEEKNKHLLILCLLFHSSVILWCRNCQIDLSGNIYFICLKMHKKLRYLICWAFRNKGFINMEKAKLSRTKKEFLDLLRKIIRIQIETILAQIR